MYLNVQYRPAHRLAARSPRRKSLPGGCWKGVSNKRSADENLSSQGQGNDGELKHIRFRHTADPRLSFPGQTRASGSRKRTGGVTSVVASPRLRLPQRAPGDSAVQVPFKPGRVKSQGFVLGQHFPLLFQLRDTYKFSRDSSTVHAFAAVTSTDSLKVVQNAEKFIILSN